jgi:hypothetical protein
MFAFSSIWPYSYTVSTIFNYDRSFLKWTNANHLRWSSSRRHHPSLIGFPWDFCWRSPGPGQWQRHFRCWGNCGYYYPRSGEQLDSSIFLLLSAPNEFLLYPMAIIPMDLAGQAPTQSPSWEALFSIHQHLQLSNVDVLVSNAESIRCYFIAITGKIPQDLERAIKPITFFVFQQFNVVETLQRMNHMRPVVTLMLITEAEQNKINCSRCKLRLTSSSQGWSNAKRNLSKRVCWLQKSARGI